MRAFLKHLSIALIVITAFGCGKDEEANCDTTASNYSATVLIADSNPAAATYNTKVASFAFTQIIPRQKGCLPGKTSLIITNTTNKAINFDYVVNVTLNGAPLWKYNASASLAANGTQDVGVINTGDTAFDANAFVLSVTLNTK